MQIGINLSSQHSSVEQLRSQNKALQQQFSQVSKIEPQVKTAITDFLAQSDVSLKDPTSVQAAFDVSQAFSRLIDQIGAADPEFLADAAEEFSNTKHIKRKKVEAIVQSVGAAYIQALSQRVTAMGASAKLDAAASIGGESSARSGSQSDGMPELNPETIEGATDGDLGSILALGLELPGPIAHDQPIQYEYDESKLPSDEMIEAAATGDLAAVGALEQAYLEARIPLSGTGPIQSSGDVVPIDALDVASASDGNLGATLALGLQGVTQLDPYAVQYEYDADKLPDDEMIEAAATGNLASILAMNQALLEARIPMTGQVAPVGTIEASKLDPAMVARAEQGNLGAILAVGQTIQEFAVQPAQSSEGAKTKSFHTLGGYMVDLVSGLDDGKLEELIAEVIGDDGAFGDIGEVYQVLSLISDMSQIPPALMQKIKDAIAAFLEKEAAQADSVFEILALVSQVVSIAPQVEGLDLDVSQIVKSVESSTGAQESGHLARESAALASSLGIAIEQPDQESSDQGIANPTQGVSTDDHVAVANQLKEDEALALKANARGGVRPTSTNALNKDEEVGKVESITAVETSTDEFSREIGRLIGSLQYGFAEFSHQLLDSYLKRELDKSLDDVYDRINTKAFSSDDMRSKL